MSYENVKFWKSGKCNADMFLFEISKKLGVIHCSTKMRETCVFHFTFTIRYDRTLIWSWSMPYWYMSFLGWVGIVYMHIITEINEIPKLTSEWVSEWVIKLRPFVHRWPRGSYSPYKLCNHILHTGIIIFPNWLIASTISKWYIKTWKCHQSQCLNYQFSFVCQVNLIAGLYRE